MFGYLLRESSQCTCTESDWIFVHEKMHIYRFTVYLSFLFYATFGSITIEKRDPRISGRDVKNIIFLTNLFSHFKCCLPFTTCSFLLDLFKLQTHFEESDQHKRRKVFVWPHFLAESVVNYDCAVDVSQSNDRYKLSALSLLHDGAQESVWFQSKSTVEILCKPIVISSF